MVLLRESRVGEVASVLRAVQFDCLEEALAALRLGTVRFRCCVCGGNHLSTSKAAWKCAEKMWRGLGGTVVRRSEETWLLLTWVSSELPVFAPWLVMPQPPPAFVEMVPTDDVWTTVVASLAVAGEHLRVKQALAEFLKPAVASWREGAAREVRMQEECYRRAAAWFSEVADDVNAWFEFATHTAFVGERKVIIRIGAVPRGQNLPAGLRTREINSDEWIWWVAVRRGILAPGRHLMEFRYACRLLEMDVANERTGAVTTLKVPFQAWRRPSIPG